MVCDVDLSKPDATRTHTVEVARGFAAEGFDVDLLTRGPDPRIPGVRFTEVAVAEHHRIRRVTSLIANMARLLWRRRRTSRRLYVRHRWSVLIGMLVGRALGYRLVTQVDDISYGRGNQVEIPRSVDYSKRAAAIAMGRLANGVVAVTPEIKGLLVDQFRVPAEHVKVLPNGVDVEFFRPLSRDEAIVRVGLDPGLRYVAFSGHFAPWVDFDTIVHGFAVVYRQRPDARLLLIGDGTERDLIGRLAREHGVEGGLIITGFIEDRATVRDYIAASVVTLSANRLEHRARIGVSPVKLAEYLACGRAVVATKLPGLEGTLTATDAGIVVPVDPQAMGEAILGLLDPARADRLGVNGRRLAEERFSWRLIVRATVPLFGL
jgi:glycosyltransferase involved in cell wall biosynthesis